ncbi:hypothetical protein CRUP_023945, partial [Coryphaenoides rupestris]
MGEEVVEEESFPAAQYEKTYRPDAFAGSHITEVLEENQALRARLRRLEEEQRQQEARGPDRALAEAQEEVCRLKLSSEERLSSAEADYRGALGRLRDRYARDHAASRVAGLTNALSTQEVVVQHLRGQLKDLQSTKDTLAVCRIRE